MAAAIDRQIRSMVIGNTEVLRNPDLDPLSDKQLKAFAPTIFATRGRDDVSDRYGFVSSIAIVSAMRDSGFEPVEVRQSKKRGEGAELKQPFVKHMIKYRPAGKIDSVEHGDIVPQAVMINSHDRSSGFHLYAGMFRRICSNGLMVAENAIVTPIRIQHTAKMVENIIENSRKLIEGAGKVYELRDQMLAIHLDERTKIAYAKEVAMLRPPKRSGELTPEMLLEVRRPEDEADDLWHVFNRCQENMLRGGNHTVTADGKKALTRGIGRIERDVEFNVKLWKTTVETIERIQAKAKRTARKTAPAAKKTVAAADDVIG